MSHDIYMPGNITEDFIHSLCRLFSDLANRRKLIDAGCPRTKYVEKYGVDILFNRASPGDIRVQFITKDNIEIRIQQNIQVLARDREMLEATYQDVVTAINKARKDRQQQVPINIKTNDDTPPSEKKEKDSIDTAFEQAFLGKKNTVEGTPEIIH